MGYSRYRGRRELSRCKKRKLSSWEHEGNVFETNGLKWLRGVANK